MEDESRFVSESIEEMLVALASGVREAQEALNEIAPVDAFGRPLPTYHIPYLDFEIGVQITTQRQSTGRPILQVVRAAAPGQGQNSTTRSTISGRLVALPPGEGLPLTVLRLDAAAGATPRTHTLTVELANTAGERLAGRRVELNLDAATSRQLSRANGVAAAALPQVPRAGTRLSQAVLVTDEQGAASAVVTIDPAEDPRAIIVVTARAGTTVTSLSLRAGGGS